MVMPCSRSARRPSVSSAKIHAAGGLAGARLRDRRQLVFVDALGIEQQAADQGALAIVHAAGGGETQQLFVLLLVEKALQGRFAVGSRGMAGVAAAA